MPTDPTETFQRIPDYQVLVDARANASTLLSMDKTEGASLREFVESLEVDDASIITTDDISKEDAAAALTEVEVTVDGVAADPVLTGRALALNLALGAIRNAVSGTSESGGVELFDDEGVNTLRVLFPTQAILGEDPAFAAGLIPEYLNDSQVRFSPGYIRVGSGVKGSTSPVTATVTTFPAANSRGTVYFYVSAAVSGIEIYTSTEAPSLAPNAAGWYKENDRCIAGLRSPQQADIIQRFHAVDTGGGAYSLWMSNAGDTDIWPAETTVGLYTFANTGVDGTYKDMNANDHNTASSVPVGVNLLHIGVYSERSGTGIARATVGTDMSGATLGADYLSSRFWLHEENDHGKDAVTLPMNPVTRKVFIGVMNDAANVARLEILGWGFKR